MEHKLLGEYLIELGKVDPQDIQDALMLQAAHRQRDYEPTIGEVLIDMGIVDQEDINTALAEQECDRKGIPVLT